jgi:hypothetical protein
MDLNSNTQEIIFEEVINKINHLGKEADKNDFIINFNQVKKQIITIDKVLEQDNDLDPSTPIDKLFEMLELYSGVLDNKDEKEQLNIHNFKNISNIVKMIEKKLQDPVEITEIK